MREAFWGQQGLVCHDLQLTGGWSNVPVKLMVRYMNIIKVTLDSRLPNSSSFCFKGVISTVDSAIASLQRSFNQRIRHIVLLNI